MTKEEYLKRYKEDSLAEICEQLEKEKDYYKDEVNSYKRDAQMFQKNADDLSSYWKSMDRLFDKLQTIPAKDFIKLYYMMQDLIQDDIKSIPIRQNTDSISTFVTAYN